MCSQFDKFMYPWDYMEFQYRLQIKEPRLYDKHQVF